MDKPDPIVVMRRAVVMLKMHHDLLQELSELVSPGARSEITQKILDDLDTLSDQLQKLSERRPGQQPKWPRPY